MIVVTSGSPYIDIDSYAGCIAYAELLNLKGLKAIAASTSILNESITDTIRSWNTAFVTNYKTNINDEFIIIDISDPKSFDKEVVLGNIKEIIDHHTGFEACWKNILGDKSDISLVGSVCTLIYEKWQLEGRLGDMNVTSARLLISGILDNTLNFKAFVTTEADKAAYVALIKIANLPQDWATQYFSECQSLILKDVTNAITNDTKTLSFRNLNIGDIAVGQLVIWDGKEVLNNYLGDIKKVMNKTCDNWFVNIVSISEETSYFISEDNLIQGWAKKLFNVEFNDSIAPANRLWLRKEIVKQDAIITL
jgi:inorganic pyrophosphatase/exopolyphosphatase